MNPECASPEQWARFLKPIAASVRNPPTETDFKARVAAVVTALDIPAAWLTQPWRQQEAMRKFAFWPAVFDIAEFFEPELREQRERLDRSERLALPAPEPNGELMTPEERKSCAEAARRLAAELRGGGSGAVARTAVRPSSLSEGALLAHYDHLAGQGNQAAAARAAMIRAKMEATNDQ